MSAGSKSGSQKENASSSTSRAPTELATTLLTEHLGFTPIAVIDDLINAVNDLIYQASSSLEAFVDEVLGGVEANAGSGSTGLSEKDQGIHAFETLLENLVDKNFDLFELYALRNTFYIPPNLLGLPIKGDSETTLRTSRIVLDHHQGLDLTATESDDQELDQEILLTRQRLRAARRLSVSLNEGLVSLSKRKTGIDEVYRQLSFVYDMGQSAGVSPLLPPLGYVTSQLSALQATLLSLHTMTTAVSPPFPENLYPTLHLKGYHAKREAYLKRTTQALIEDRQAADLAADQARPSGRNARRSSVRPEGTALSKNSELGPRKRPLGEEAQLERILLETARIGGHDGSTEYQEPTKS